MRLPVLDTELALGIALAALDLKVVVPVRLEDLLHDVEHAQILENLALARERQEPEPRHDLGTVRGELVFGTAELHEAGDQAVDVARDRKSTRLNSSHLVISYAVFCLKKKINNITTKYCTRVTT